MTLVVKKIESFFFINKNTRIADQERPSAIRVRILQYKFHLIDVKINGFVWRLRKRHHKE